MNAVNANTNDPSKPGRQKWPGLFRGLRPLSARSRRPRFPGRNRSGGDEHPASLGYATIAGMPAVSGLYTLFLPLLAFAAFGSSSYLVVAADSATAAILAGGVSRIAPVGGPRYVALAGMVALLTAVLLLLARLLRLGFLADFLSRTVLVGFLTGVGFQVGIAVLGEMLGLEVSSHRTVGQLTELVRGLPGSPAIAGALGGGGRRRPRAGPLRTRVPGPLIAVAGAIAASAALDFAGHGIG